MNCEQANQLDLAAFLSGLGLEPTRVQGSSIWYHSPLHHDKTPSFKVNRLKNTWYDFSLGKGGTLVDFICALNGCGIAEALQKIDSGNNSLKHSFSRQNTSTDQQENSIRILQVAEQVTDLVLRQYLNQRHIDFAVAAKLCQQVHYQNGEKRYTALGFKNNAGGYELRAPGFKGSSSPKFISYLDNGANAIMVFEGFFDFMTYQSIYLNQSQLESNYLVLNSLSFFPRSLLLMEKHEHIHLYLDNDKSGKDCTRQLQQRTEKVIDESCLYQGYKDLNEWAIHVGQSQKQSQSRGLHR